MQLWRTFFLNSVIINTEPWAWSGSQHTSFMCRTFFRLRLKRKVRFFVAVVEKKSVSPDSKKNWVCFLANFSTKCVWSWPGYNAYRSPFCLSLLLCKAHNIVAKAGTTSIYERIAQAGKRLYFEYIGEKKLKQNRTSAAVRGGSDGPPAALCGPLCGGPHHICAFFFRRKRKYKFGSVSPQKHILGCFSPRHACLSVCDRYLVLSIKASYYDYYTTTSITFAIWQCVCSVGQVAWVSRTKGMMKSQNLTYWSSASLRSLQIA